MRCDCGRRDLQRPMLLTIRILWHHGFALWCWLPVAIRTLRCVPISICNTSSFSCCLGGPLSGSLCCAVVKPGWWQRMRRCCWRRAVQWPVLFAVGLLRYNSVALWHWLPDSVWPVWRVANTCSVRSPLGGCLSCAVVEPGWWQRMRRCRWRRAVQWPVLLTVGLLWYNSVALWHWLSDSVWLV